LDAAKLLHSVLPQVVRNMFLTLTDDNQNKHALYKCHYLQHDWKDKLDWKTIAEDK